MPVLQARESIMRINEMIYAGGRLKETDSRAYMRELQVAAAGDDEIQTVAARPKSIQEMARLAGGTKTRVAK